MKKTFPLLRLFLVLPAVGLIANTSSSAAAKPAQSRASVENVTFDQCLQSLRPAAAAKGVNTQTMNSYLKNIQPDMKVLDFLDSQPEFKTAIWDYMASLVDQERVDTGLKMISKWKNTLDSVEQTYGVDKTVVAAFWGVESDYGVAMGKRPLLESLTTLSCYGRRQPFFRNELYALLTILQTKEMQREDLKGSWAGAFGHTQFMPRDYLGYAVDFDKDGKRDIVNSVPDSLGTTANYLKHLGWVSGLPWGIEVKVPAGYAGAVDRKQKQPIENWLSAGFELLSPKAVPAGTKLGLIMPAGAAGPAFLVTKNFDAIYGYNPAISYALAVAHLSDRFKGEGSFVTPWPVADLPLSRDQRREMQQLLITLGYDIGTADGAIGEKTIMAIKNFQQSRNLPQTGQATLNLLEALRR